jgi:hypothetical protein
VERLERFELAQQSVRDVPDMTRQEVTVFARGIAFLEGAFSSQNWPSKLLIDASAP